MADWRMEDFAALIPDSLKDCSGKVFYSGRKAFEEFSPVYILGINPGGRPSKIVDETVGKHTDKVLSRKKRDWSAYRDEKWAPKGPGSNPMQKRVRNLCCKIGVDIGEVPASNVIFNWSRTISKLRQSDVNCMVEVCWPFHQRVIDTLGVRIVVCLGKDAGRFVREKLSAHRQIDKFVENNRRRWRGHTHKSLDGFKVVTLTHPSRADWTKSISDPTGLVVRAMHGLGE